MNPDLASRPIGCWMTACSFDPEQALETFHSELNFCFAVGKMQGKVIPSGKVSDDSIK
jgi:hypothetical protein